MVLIAMSIWFLTFDLTLLIFVFVITLVDSLMIFDDVL